HGYDFIEIRTMDKLPEYLQDHSIDDLANFFKSNHIKPLALNALVFFNNRDEAGLKETIAEFKNMLEVAGEIGAQYIVAVPLVTQEKILETDSKDS
ncbi:TIM barrel protein, partial [Bacillus sp. GbtcB15]|uniref:TIM barrel protein n=1 Tax=Bacillus sp. GbtcB15 TaxID=2824760 RepID=UPI001C31137E